MARNRKNQLKVCTVTGMETNINNFYAHSNKLNTNIHSYLDKKSSKTDMINNKIVVLPYFLGEKSPIHDVDAKGTISGLGLNNTVYDLWIAR